MYIYRLQILSSKSYSEEQLNNVIGVSSNFPHADWGIEIIQSDENFSGILVYFLSLLEGKYEKLESIGISREDISIWVLYEYEGQCNMEYDPVSMKKIGENGIVLCISCWEKEFPLHQQPDSETSF